MLTEMQIKDIERQLNNSADLYYSTRRETIKERNRGYCQGIDFLLSKLGYSIIWEDGKAHIEQD